jgi:hypothetical protein
MRKRRALIKYGWTRTRIKHVDSDGSITCEGGQVDELSFGPGVIPNTRVGDVYLVNIQPCPPFAFGQITEARRITASETKQ